jgi:hypothetical protein
MFLASWNYGLLAPGLFDPHNLDFSVEVEGCEGCVVRFVTVDVCHRREIGNHQHNTLKTEINTPVVIVGLPET